jgi:hypothetical protein
MKNEVLYFDGCPNHKPAVERVQQLLAEEGLSAEVAEVNVSDESIAQKVGFPADARRLLNAAQRPSQSPQRDDLLLL